MEYDRPLIGTRVFGDVFKPEDYSSRLDKFIEGARTFGPVLIVSQENYKYLQELQDYVNKNNEFQDFNTVSISLSKTEGVQSPADMCNQIIKMCYKSRLAYFGIVSNDLAKFIPNVMPEMIDRLRNQQDLTTIGVAVQNIHNLGLLGEISEHGMQELNTGNYATLFHNNSFAVHRLILPGEINPIDRLFPRTTDQGKLGIIKVDGQDVPIGGNEEIALVLRLLKKGVSLNTQLLAGKYTIIRDSNTELSSVDKKIMRRPQVARVYQQYYGITDEELTDYLQNHYRIIIDA